MTQDREFLMEWMSDGDMDHTDIVEWVWRNRIPKNRVTLVSGQGGEGKTHVIVKTIAHVLRQEEFPDGERPEVEPGPIFFITTEQTMSEIRGIARAQGCDHEDFVRMARLPIILNQGRRVFFDIDADKNTLITAIRKFRPVIIVFDPLIEFHSKRDIDSHQIRSLMVLLDEICQQEEVTMIATIHWNKNEKQSSSNRSSGSHQYRDSVRSMITIEPASKSDIELKRFYQDKHNLGPAPIDLNFRIERPLGRVEWEVGDSDMDDETRSLVERAERWLVDTLTDGPVQIHDILDRSGFSESTVHRARAKMKSLIFTTKTKNPDGTYNSVWDIRSARNNFGAGKLKTS